MKKNIQYIIILFAFLAIGSIQAQNVLDQARIYINPGHGGWGANDRPLATINYAIMDTLGFFETNTNLWKGLKMRDELEKAGAGYVRMSRTRNGIKQGSATNPNGIPEIDEMPGQLATLSVIAADVEENNMDYFLSIHSNAATEGAITNFPILLYRGTDDAVGNGLVNTKSMALDAWKYIINNQATYFSHYTGATQTNVRGDISFMNGQSTVNGYTGYYGVLKHGCDGFLSEGCFHTYQPERHRLLNPDYCGQEGIRYARAVRAWFGDKTETKGSIMGTVKDKNQALTHALYQYKIGSYDQYKPLNLVDVVLKNENGQTLATYKTDKEYNGLYIFNDLEPGTYTLEYDIAGYWKETEEIEVVANETSFINKLLTDLEKEDPNIDKEEEIAEVWDYPHPQQDGDVAGASSYSFAKTHENDIDALAGLTVRRVLMRDSKYYVLAIDANKDPKLLIINPTTGELIKEMSTHGISTEGYNGKSHLYNLSDIAFTQDGVLMGANSTCVGKEGNSYQTGDFYIYKWQTEGAVSFEDADPAVFLRLETNNSNSLYAAGNNNSNLVANSFTVSGTLDNLKIFFNSHPSNNWSQASNWNVRLVGWKVVDGAVVDMQYNNTNLSIYSNGLSENSQITLSPTSPDRFIIDGHDMQAIEFEMNWLGNDKIQVGTFNADVSTTSKGGTYFRYANRIYMASVDAQKQADNSYDYKLELYDITDGFNKAVKLGETTVDLTSTSLTNMVGFGEVDNADINLYLMADGKTLRYSTRNIAQTSGKARVFAYDLSSEYDKNKDVHSIQFNLNEDASNVDFILLNIETNAIEDRIELGAFTKGANEYLMDNDVLPATDTYLWALEVKADNVTRFTKISDSQSIYRFAAPKGIAIDKSPSSPHFGRVYVTNTGSGTVDSRATTTGIYVFSPDAQDITNQANTAYTGGIAWTGTSAESPRKITVTEDGRVFIADASTTKAGIYYMNPETFEAATIFTGSSVSAGSVKIGGTTVCGQIVAIGSRGTGAATQLYAVDKTSSGSTWKKLVNTYNIGTSNTWTKAATSSAAASSYVGNDNASIIPVSTGYWAGQYRGAGSNSSANPCFLYYSDSFKEAVFNSAEFKDGKGNTVTLDKASQNGGLAVNEQEGLIALSYDGGVSVFEYKLNKEGVPVVNPKFQHTLGVSGVSYDDFAFDYAGNLYAVSLAGKFVSVWAMPTDNNSKRTLANGTIAHQERTGIKDIHISTQAYPNPTDGIITVSANEHIQSIQIYNISGNLVKSFNGAGSHQATVDVSELPAGMYLVRVNGTETIKLRKR